MTLITVKKILYTGCLWCRVPLLEGVQWQNKFKFYVTLVNTRVLTGGQPSDLILNHFKALQFHTIQHNIHFQLIHDSKVVYSNQVLKLKRMHFPYSNVCCSSLCSPPLRSQSKDSPYNSTSIRKNRYKKTAECLNCYTTMVRTLWCVSFVKLNSRYSKIHAR